VDNFLLNNIFLYVGDHIAYAAGVRDNAGDCQGHGHRGCAFLQKRPNIGEKETHYRSKRETYMLR
jgi:hypothetical protein